MQDNREIKVQVGQFLQSEQEARELVVGLHDGKPVYLGEVAQVALGEETPVQRSWMGQGQASYPAVTLAIGKQPGQNAVEVAKRVEERVESLRNRLIPAGVEVTVTRDYGVTAETKSNTLIGKLIFATTAVVLLVLVSMGWREALVVGVAIVITLALTLFASWAWGFTLNRVSLFALIFSIGILVDDAIVVVENIHRHRGLQGVPQGSHSGRGGRGGGPTILATLTVIAALLPMAFVSGLMGPYMSPIPINASMGMLIPCWWPLSSPLAGRALLKSEGHVAHGEAKGRALSPSDDPFPDGAGAKRARRKLWLVILLLVAGAPPPCPWCSGWCSRCSPSTTSRNSSWCSTCRRGDPGADRAHPAGGGSGACQGARGEGLPDYAGTAAPSTSTGWCATTSSAAAPTWVTSGQSGGQA